MCRFIAYIGAPVVMDELLYQPDNSLIHQSYKAQEREEPLNGDGFGIGWYDKTLDNTPAIFVSVRPAWNNKNLRSIAPKIRSSCIFAHVRAASMGGVSEDNCHPFRYGNYLFMHNGHIGGFRSIKRALRRRLSDEVYDWLRGETDSEHFFALFLDNL
ncbi:MAG: class II glutamine amidotransferase, partial [Calditrichaeota bacterium]